MKRLALIPLLFVLACAGNRPLQIVQISHSSLAVAQDLEAQLCWGVANVRLGPTDRTHCTAPVAVSIGLTDAKHQSINKSLEIALNLESAAIVQLRAGAKSVDMAPMEAALVQVLTYVGQLQTNSTVAQIQTLLTGVLKGKK